MINLHGFVTFVESLDTYVQTVAICKLKRANKPKVPMLQAQDPVVLIGELVKALNLYSNRGVGNHSHVNKNFNAHGTSKWFWMQKTRTN